MGSRVFTRMQYGKETTRGTLVAATRILVGGEHPPIKPDRVPRFPQENLGVRVASNRSWIGQFMVSDGFTLRDAYFQALPLLYSIAMKGGVTPSEQTGGQADWQWPFVPNMAAPNLPDTITLEVGDDTQAYRCGYVMGEKLKFSGQINQGAEASPAEAALDYFARQWDPVSFTASLSLPTPEAINSKLTRFYLDTTWAAVGTTEKIGLLRDYDVEVLTGNHPQQHGGANQYFDTHAEGMFEVMANFTIEGDANANAIWTAMRNQTLAVIRLEVEGAQIGSGVKHRHRMDMAGKWEDVTPLGKSDRGDNLHSARLHGIYDNTGAKIYQGEVRTNQNTI